jgi:hypothetical protein
MEEFNYGVAPRMGTPGQGIVDLCWISCSQVSSSVANRQEVSTKYIYIRQNNKYEWTELPILANQITTDRLACSEELRISGSLSAV